MNISSEEVLIRNLLSVTYWHKKNCNDPACGVSLYTLRETAQYIANHAPSSDKGRLGKLVEEFKWS